MQLMYYQYRRYYQLWSLENPKKDILSFISFFSDAISRVFDLLLTPLYLRNVEKGKGVVCRQRPSILVKGRLLIGNDVRIWSNIQQTRLSVFHDAMLLIGKGTYINGARISTKQMVVIGCNCTIAPEVLIMDSDFHDLSNQSKPGVSKPVIIDDNVWIANRATILKGVTIGKHSVVAAGSVVTKDVPPYTLVGGNPARVIKQLN